MEIFLLLCSFRMLLLMLISPCCSGFALSPRPRRTTSSGGRSFKLIVNNRQRRQILASSFFDPTNSIILPSSLEHETLVDSSLHLLSSSLPSLIPSDVISTTKLIIGTLGLGLGVPLLIAAIQGATSIVNFRNNYANAPVPKIPCHGLVIATTTAADDGADSVTMMDDWRALVRSHMETKTSYDEFNSSSLKLLVIGDSLAVGVGQSVRATPTLPEAIATQLSKQVGGKPVYWTCFGETGASTPWIIRMIEQANVQKYDDFLVENNLSNSEYEAFQAHGLMLMNDSDDDECLVLDWKKRLGRYRQTFRELYFDPESWGTFDIVVLLTGANDLKSVIFPFLLDEEDKELRREIKNRGEASASLIDNIELFMDILSRKMERGVQRMLDDMAKSAEELSESVRRNVEEVENQFMLLSFDNSTDAIVLPTTASRNNTNNVGASTSTTACQTDETSTQKDVPPPVFIEPLFALPGSPIRLVPAFRRAPLQWFARPVFDIVDDMKKNFAESFPCDILFIPDPPLEDAIDYEARRGRIWNDKQTEHVLLSLQTITDEERESIESKMKLYYESKGVPYDTVNSDVALSEWPGISGTKIFSADTIHPNEAGYDMFGRHIGKVVAKRLQEKQLLSECSVDDADDVEARTR